MKQYLDLLKQIKEQGTLKDPARKNLPKTLSLFGTRLECNMKDGFPLLTTKKIHFKSIVTELLWFLKGDTNIKYLVNNSCNIWNQDAYRWYLKTWNQFSDCFIIKKDDIEEPYTFEEFIEKIKQGEEFNTSIPSNYILGDLGKVYGHQWRNQNGVDQVQTVVDRINSEPEGRYAILDAWNPADFSEMALPPCHLLYQFNCRKLSLSERYEIANIIHLGKAEFYAVPFDYSGNIKRLEELNIPKYYLDLQLYQRSCDTFLGVPFNIASGSLLLHIIAKLTNTISGKFIWVGGDTHVYENHLEQVNLQLLREPLSLPKLKINKELKSVKDLELLKYEDFELIDYKYHETIKAELKTGL